LLDEQLLEIIFTFVTLKVGWLFPDPTPVLPLELLGLEEESESLPEVPVTRT
jgi:hypothetical protein